VVTIRETPTLTPDEHDQLTALLVDVVNEGASIGFLMPLDPAEAEAYWRGVLSPGRVLLLVEDGGRIVGTAQLHLAPLPNGHHRAEVAKVLVHPSARRRGIARSLMLRLEEIAHRERRTLLVLDTRVGDPSNGLYQSLGYVEVGQIPGYARTPSGADEFDATTIYYKPLG
jgi:ribosomal protein S18 acetylase RimI-like enzyme